MKIIPTLIIFGLCANVCFGAAVTATSNSGAFSSSSLNSSVYQILKGTNSTDSAIWDFSTASTTTGGVTTAATVGGISSEYTWFGPGASNDTSYLYGVPLESGATIAAGWSGNTITTVRVRKINNTIAANGSDTTEAAVISDSAVTTTIYNGEYASWGVGPGYLAAISTGSDGAATANNQVWVSLLSGSGASAQTTKLTTTSDVTTATSSAGCTDTTFGVGNIWYDIGAGAFFYTYWKNVASYAVNSCTGTTTSATTIYLGGLFTNNTAYWSSGPISVSAATAGDSIYTLIAGGDNTVASANIIIAYKDYTATTTYWSKTAKSANTSAIASFSSLIKDSSPTTTGNVTASAMAYTPVAVWSSNVTYGIALENETTTATYVNSVRQNSSTSPTYSYDYTIFYNGSSTGVSSGLVSSSADGLSGFWGYQLNTGYTFVVGTYSSTYTSSYSMQTYFLNGTVNGTATSATTIGTLAEYTPAPQFYEDVNGTLWIGWLDVDTANYEVTYSAYLAKLIGQVNVSSGAKVILNLSIVVVFFLASIFI